MHQPMSDFSKQTEDCAVALRAALADTFAFYFKAHAFHWNVKGSDFPQLHEFFGDIYADVHGAVDDLAERLRTLDEPAPISVTELMQPSSIDDAENGSAASMVLALYGDNQVLIASLTDACTAAMKAGKAGLANFLQDRIDKHAKWGWMLKATANL